eukprot:COSAG02_NODE_594_length_19849_cov_323.373114_16_plen_340_part_00
MEPDWPSTFATHVAQAGLRAAWQFRDRGSWHSMDDNMCAVLEQVWTQPVGAHGAEQVVCTDDKRTVFIVNNVLHGARYRYDLAPDGSGLQRNLDTRGPARLLQRIETEPRAPAVCPGAVVIVDPPAPVLPEQHKGARVLEPSDEAHSYASTELSKSLGGTFAAESLLQVEEIVNEEMAACFAAKSAAMGARCNEKWLWHGTTGDSAKKIVKNGFNRSFCGANGTVYGDGVYFASSASLSMKYATPDLRGRRYIFLCSVLCGRFAQGHRGMKEPPPLDPARAGEVSEACPVAYTAEEAADGCTLFDSVVDRMGRAPNIIVVFNDVQAIPRYLLTIDGSAS